MRTMRRFVEVALVVISSFSAKEVSALAVGVAKVSNFTIQLEDLNLADGVLPSINFAAPFGSVFFIVENSKDPYYSVSKQNPVSGFFPDGDISLSMPSSYAYSGYVGDATSLGGASMVAMARAEGSLGEYVLSSGGLILSYSGNPVVFTVSPNTRVSVGGWVENYSYAFPNVLPSHQEFGYSSVEMSFVGDASKGDYQKSFKQQVTFAGLTSGVYEDHLLSYLEIDFLNRTNASINGEFYMYVHGEAYSNAGVALVVPEPGLNLLASAALFGWGLFCYRAKRRFIKIGRRDR